MNFSFKEKRLMKNSVIGLHQPFLCSKHNGVVLVKSDGCWAYKGICQNIKGSPAGVQDFQGERNED